MIPTTSKKRLPAHDTPLTTQTRPRNNRLCPGQAALAAKEAGPYSERSPCATASGQAESTKLFAFDSRQAAPGRVASVKCADTVPSPAKAPSSVEGSVAVARGAVRGANSSGGGRPRSEAGDRCRTAGVLPCVMGRQAEEGKTSRLAQGQTVPSTGVRFDAGSSAVVAVASAHRAGVAPPPGGQKGREGAGAVGAAAAPVARVAPVSCSRGVVAPVARLAVKVSPPGVSSEGAAVVAASAPIGADVGARVAAVAPRHTEQAADVTGGGSGGEGVVDSSREGGVFGGDPEVTVSAAPGV